MLSLPRLYSIRDKCGTLTKLNQQVYKQSAQRNTCPTVTLFTTNQTWADVGLKLGLCSGMPVTNCLSCCTGLGGTIIWDMYPYMAFTSGRIRIPYSCSSQRIYKQFDFLYRQNTTFHPDPIYAWDNQSPTVGNQQPKDFPLKNPPRINDVVNPITPIPRIGKPVSTPGSLVPTPQPDYSPPTRRPVKHEPYMYEAPTRSVLKNSNAQGNTYF